MKKVTEEMHAAAQAAIREGLLFHNKALLKDLCRAQLLKVSGPKDTLVERLMQYYNCCQIEAGIDPTTGRATTTIKAWYDPIRKNGNP